MLLMQNPVLPAQDQLTDGCSPWHHLERFPVPGSTSAGSVHKPLSPWVNSKSEGKRCEALKVTRKCLLCGNSLSSLSLHTQTYKYILTNTYLELLESCQGNKINVPLHIHAALSYSLLGDDPTWNLHNFPPRFFTLCKATIKYSHQTFPMCASIRIKMPVALFNFFSFAWARIFFLLLVNAKISKSWGTGTMSHG